MSSFTFFFFEIVQLKKKVRFIFIFLPPPPQSYLVAKWINKLTRKLFIIFYFICTNIVRFYKCFATCKALIQIPMYLYKIISWNFLIYKKHLDILMTVFIEFRRNNLFIVKGRGTIIQRRVLVVVTWHKLINRHALKSCLTLYL